MAEAELRGLEPVGRRTWLMASAVRVGLDGNFGRSEKWYWLSAVGTRMDSSFF